MPQGNLFSLFFCQCFSVSAAMPGGSIQDIVILTSLQPGEQPKYLIRYVSVCHIRMHTGTAAATELMTMKGIHLRSEAIAAWVSF